MVKLSKEKQAAYDQMIGYQNDPVGFATEILSLNPKYVWSKMRELCEAVRDHQFVAVRAGHSVSKTFTLGNVIVPWFKTCFQPSTVITTAPSDNQVRNQLWREIHAAYAGARVPLGGDMRTLTWNLKPSKKILEQFPAETRGNWEKNFAIGFSTSPDSATEHATKMQGWHNEHIMVVLDEACGIMPQIWRTVMESLITDENCKCIAIGNPTDPESEFAKACYSSDPSNGDNNEPYTSDDGWHVITISGKDTPNYKKRKKVIPGLASYEYVQRIIKKYGKNSDAVRYRVLGLFPTFKEGTYYGAKLAAARKEKRVGFFPHDETAKVHTFNDYGDIYTGTLFVQFIGNEIRIIDDYWDNEGQGLPGWAKVLQAKGYIYGDHFAGPDLVTSNRKAFQTGKTTIDVAAELGLDLTPVIAHSFNDGIEAGRGIWQKIRIHKTDCDTFIKAAAGYGKKKNQALSQDDKIVYHDTPSKTWHRHIMDAFRHLAVAYRYMEIDNEVIGFPGALNDYGSDSYEIEPDYFEIGAL